MLLRVVNCSNGRGDETLQDLCLQRISSCIDRYTAEQIAEINSPCLQQLGFKLPLSGVLTHEELLKKRGVDLVAVYKAFLRRVCQKSEPISPEATLPPHVYDSISSGWEDSLSVFLSRIVFAPVFYEHDLMLSSQGSTSPYTDYLQDITTKYSDLQQLFVPADLQNVVSWQNHHISPRGIPHLIMKKFVELVALKIRVFLVDSNFCSFFNDPTNSRIFESLCKSVRSVSIYLNSGDSLLDILTSLTTCAHLDEVSLHCVSPIDMEHFDYIMSQCSGGVGYYETAAGFRECVKFRQEYFSRRPLRSRDKIHCIDERNGEHLSNMDGSKESDAETIVRGMNHCNISDKSVAGSKVTSFTFDASRLIPAQMYNQVLKHHFEIWNCLVQLCLNIPNVDTDLATVITRLIDRPTFKSLNLTDCLIKASALDIILSRIAESRKETAMDKLVLVDLMDPYDRVMERYTSRMAYDVSYYYAKRCKSQVSKRLGSLGSFKGVKMLEVFGRRIHPKIQQLLFEFVKGNCGLEQLYIYDCLDRPIVNRILLSLTENARPLTHLHLEGCKLMGEEDFQALHNLLATLSETLISLSLKGSFCIPGDHESKGVTAGKFVEMIFTPALKNLCLGRNRLTLMDIVRIMRVIGRGSPGPHRPTLDVLDVTCNGFNKSHIEHFQNDVYKAARDILCDDSPDIAFLNLYIPPGAEYE